MRGSALVVCVLYCLMTLTMADVFVDHCTTGSANNAQLKYNLNLANEIEFGVS